MEYLVIKSFRAALLLCSLALLNLAFVIHRIGSSDVAVPFRGTRLTAYPYVMWGLTVIVLVGWIVDSPSKLEKQLFALGLGGTSSGRSLTSVPYGFCCCRSMPQLWSGFCSR